MYIQCWHCSEQGLGVICFHSCCCSTPALYQSAVWMVLSVQYVSFVAVQLYAVQCLLVNSVNVTDQISSNTRGTGRCSPRAHPGLPSCIIQGLMYSHLLLPLTGLGLGSTSLAAMACLILRTPFSCYCSCSCSCKALQHCRLRSSAKPPSAKVGEQQLMSDQKQSTAMAFFTRHQ